MAAVGTLDRYNPSVGRTTERSIFISAIHVRYSGSSFDIVALVMSHAAANLS